jgi:hypothetical protein
MEGRKRTHYDGIAFIIPRYIKMNLYIFDDELWVPYPQIDVLHEFHDVAFSVLPMAVDPRQNAFQ